MKRHYFRRRPSSSTKKKQLFFQNEKLSFIFFSSPTLWYKIPGSLTLLHHFIQFFCWSCSVNRNLWPLFPRVWNSNKNHSSWWEWRHIFIQKREKKPTENSLYKSHQGFPFQAFSFEITLAALRRQKSSNCVGTIRIKNRVYTIRSSQKVVLNTSNWSRNHNVRNCFWWCQNRTKIAINVELSMKMVTVANVHVVLITNLCEFFGDLWHEIFGN